MEMASSEPGKRLQEVTAYGPAPGGMIAHVAIAARRLGMRSAFIGKVGNDPFGHHLHNVLRTEGVGTSGLRFDEHARTTLCFHAMPSPDYSEYVHYRNPGADSMLRADQLDEQLLSEARIFHFGSLSITHDPSRSATRRAISIAEQNESLITFGVNYQPSLWPDPDEARIRITSFLPFVHLVIVDQADLRLLCETEDAEEGSRTLLNYGPLGCVVIGADGSAYARTDSFALKVDRPLSTERGSNNSRAGFTAALLWQLVETGAWRMEFQQDSLQHSLQYASAAAILRTGHLETMDRFPDAPSLHKFVRLHYPFKEE